MKNMNCLKKRENQEREEKFVQNISRMMQGAVPSCYAYICGVSVPVRR